MNLLALLEAGARETPDREALRLPERRLSYAELSQAVARLAGGLRSEGIQAGQAVALLLPNSAAFVLSYLAVLRLGAVAVPVNALSRGGELAHCLAVSEARALVHARRLRKVVQEARDVGPLPPLLLTDAAVGEDEASLDRLLSADPAGDLPDLPADHPAVMVFTHAVDGVPRGAVLSQGGLWANVLDSAFHFGIGDGCKVLTALPLFHTFGATAALWAALASRGTSQILPRFSPKDTLAKIQEWRPDVFAAVPTMYGAILGTPGIEAFDLSAVKLWICGGMRLPEEILRGVERLTGSPLREGYGLTEASPVCAFNSPPGPRKIHSIGQAYRSVEARIARPDDPEHRELPRGREGELVVRGPNVFLGYHGDPAMTREKLRDGWLHTGDRGTMDDEGYIFLTGLLKPMHLTGGFNIYPEEVRRSLEELPEIQEVLEIDGVPDLVQGELVRARVRLSPGADLDADALTGLARRKMALYKVPRIWRIE